jgi:hypothetical protein
MSRILAVCLSIGLAFGSLTSLRAQKIDLTEQNANRDIAALEPLPDPEASRRPAFQTTNETRLRNEVETGTAVAATPRRFHYALSLNLRAVYDDNIFLTDTDHVNDFYFTIEPDVTLGFGDIVGTDQNFVRVDYAPGAILYLDHSSADALQHIIRLQGQYHFQRLSITFGQDIQLLNGANLNSISSTGPNPVPPIRLDAGANTDQNLYTTNAAFSYDLTGKTFLTGAIQYLVSDYPASLIGSETLSGNLFFNFTYSPKLVIGVGGTAGYNWVDDPSPNQSYEQINGRVTYQVSGKVSLNASGGVEFRQFQNSGRNGSYVSPVYELTASYEPFDGTSVSLSGSRRTQNSAVAAGQDYSSTNITFGVRQRFLQRIYFGVALGYENSSYFSTSTGTDAPREDNYYFVQPAVDITLTRYWTSGAYYLHRQNNSSSNFGFDNNQAGVRTSLEF